ELTKVVELSGVTNPTVINETFTVTVTGPSHPAPGHDVVFTVTSGVLQAPSTVTLSDLIPGDYTITEADAGPEWIETVPAGPVTVSPGGTCATATVANTYVPGSLEVQKIVLDLANASDATFTINVVGPSYPAPAGTDLVFNLVADVITGPDGGDTACLSDLIPGAYTVTETVPAHWEDPVLNPVSGVVTVDPGDECDDGAELVTVTNAPVIPECDTAVAAQGPSYGANLFPDASNWFTYITYSRGDGTVGTPRQYPIFTGQTQLCGTLYVWNTGPKLYVKYTMLDNGWIGFSSYHLQVDCSLEDLLDAIVNQDGDGNPVPGQCEYTGNVDSVDEIELEADISGCSNNIWIFAHSVICYYPD
ncbi:MAG: hypothetical protein V3V23_00390, partial [Dehalococcoidales bacterium]